jgi:hypothetical protein
MRPCEINPSQKRAGGVAQGAGPEFKSQYHKKKKRKKKLGRRGIGWGSNHTGSASLRYVARLF